jgi:hypothetical protein
MRKVSCAVLSVLLIVLFSANVIAVPDLLLDVKTIEDEIDFDGVAKYTVEVTNNRDDKMDLLIPTPRNNWDINIKPYLLELYPGQSKNIEISISPPKTVDSGIFSVYFTFKENGNVLDYKYLHVKINEDSPVVEAKVRLIEEIEAQESWSEGFLSKSYSVILINKGNTETSGIWETPISQTDKFFFNSETLHELEDLETETKVKWAYSLPVQKEVEYTYTISYIPLAASVTLIAIALLILGLYYMNRYKLVKTIKHSKDGYIKVEIALKNKTGKKQKNITIEDYIPVPLLISRQFGTLSPTAIKKQKDKLLVVWKFEELQPKEERLLSYKMKSKLEIEGKLTIPPAYVTQKDGKKKIEIFSKIKQL